MAPKAYGCPFCGAAADVWISAQDNKTNVADCSNKNCAMYEFYDGMGMPLEQWNTRPIEDDLERKLEILEYTYAEAVTRLTEGEQDD